MSRSFHCSISLRSTSRRAGSAPFSAPGRPPLAEAPAGLVLTERTLVEPELEEEGERLAHHAAGGAPQLGHHRVAVEVGPDGGQLLLLAQDGHPLLELVH